MNPPPPYYLIIIIAAILMITGFVVAFASGWKVADESINSNPIYLFNSSAAHNQQCDEMLLGDEWRQGYIKELAERCLR